MRLLWIQPCFYGFYYVTEEDLKFYVSRWNMIVRVNDVLNRTVNDSDRRFNNLCGSHLQSQCELYHVSGWY